MRAEAVAAALTSTSLRERWREPVDGATAWARVGGALAEGWKKPFLILYFKVLCFVFIKSKLMRSYLMLRFRRCFSLAEVDCGGRNNNNNDVLVTVCEELTVWFNLVKGSVSEEK